MAIIGQIRIAKKFTGTKRKCAHVEVMQQYLCPTHDSGPIWMDVTTVWATPEDEQKNKIASEYEYLHQER